MPCTNIYMCVYVWLSEGDRGVENGLGMCVIGELGLTASTRQVHDDVQVCSKMVIRMIDSFVKNVMKANYKVARAQDETVLTSINSTLLE